MKVYVVSYGWVDARTSGIRPMTPKVFYNDRDAEKFCDFWKKDCNPSISSYAFYDEIEVE